MVSKKASVKGASSSVAPAGGYEAVVIKVIAEQKSRTGVSVPAILKGMHAELPGMPEDKLKIQTRHALQRMVAKETVVKVKASYKLTEKGKKKEKKAAAPAKKKTEKAVAKPKKTIVKKDSGKKKSGTNKASSKKAPTKAKSSSKAAATKPKVKKSAASKKGKK
mmetsp:Transcript_11724/g.25334  ORF Transcript_11724/g.25334 Transcript_11724/m.25334 type:complete len:164 (-) Transcript_11724:1567-2058(-)